MQGSPLLRALVLAAALVAMGALIASLVNRAPATAIPTSAPPPEAELAATLTVQLSAPVRSLSLTTLDGERTLLAVGDPEREADHAIRIPLRDGGFTALLNLTWTSPGDPHFLRLILEPEERESREVILHAPENLEQHAIEFTWPEP